MSPITTGNRMLLLFSLLTMAAAGCGTPSDTNGFDPDTQQHVADWVLIQHAPVAQADRDSCTECHGEDLRGGISGIACESCHINGVGALSGCTSCHGKPPAGTTAPNRRGAHAAHAAIPGIANECAVCHSGAGTTTERHFNGAADVLILSTYSSSSGGAERKPDGTCVNVSCHGGQTTPVWLAGTINVNTQCTLCHAFGTAEYTSYSSGQHSFHTNLGYSCDGCHSVSILADTHFTTLDTPVLNGFAAGTIVSTGITTYDPLGNKTCVAVCHAANPKTWL